MEGGFLFKRVPIPFEKGESVALERMSVCLPASPPLCVPWSRRFCLCFLAHALPPTMLDWASESPYLSYIGLAGLGSDCEFNYLVSPDR